MDIFIINFFIWPTTGSRKVDRPEEPEQGGGRGGLGHQRLHVPVGGDPEIRER